VTHYGDRKKCYQCHRPQSSCICNTLSPIATQSCFVILMHHKEFKKTKNITGHMSHLNLPNSYLFVDNDFTHHRKLNELLNNSRYQPYILYPDEQAINVSHTPLPLENEKIALFILIDSTWACSKKMMKLSQNLHHLKRVSFTPTHKSQYKIKQQPQEYCLSTIETIHTLLNILNQQNVETIKPELLDKFLNPFKSMVNYQIEKKDLEYNVRFKKHAN
jgi:DTW domain-containing protein YfiP